MIELLRLVKKTICQTNETKHVNYWIKAYICEPWPSLMDILKPSTYMSIRLWVIQCTSLSSYCEPDWARWCDRKLFSYIMNHWVMEIRRDHILPLFIFYPFSPQLSGDFCTCTKAMGNFLKRPFSFVPIPDVCKQADGNCTFGTPTHQRNAVPSSNCCYATS